MRSSLPTTRASVRLHGEYSGSKRTDPGSAERTCTSLNGSLQSFCLRRRRATMDPRCSKSRAARAHGRRSTPVALISCEPTTARKRIAASCCRSCAERAPAKRIITTIGSLIIVGCPYSVGGFPVGTSISNTRSVTLRRRGLEGAEFGWPLHRFRRGPTINAVN